MPKALSLPSTTPAVVLFDLDGTLTDPAAGITASLAHALERVGRPVDDPAALRRFIGPPLLETFAELGVPQADLERAVAAYRDRYRGGAMFDNVLVDGMADLLARLRGRGTVLAVATSKPTPFAADILAFFGIAGSFDVIGGATLDGRRSHKADVVAHTLAELDDPDPATVVMIGDREHDVFGAAEHDVACIGVLWGYGSARELTDAGAAALCDTVDALTDLLA